VIPSDVCPLCDCVIEPGGGAAALGGRIAHLTCWLDWREGRRRRWPRRSILVVDDDEGGRYATCRTLQHANFQTLEAVDGASALHALGERPDLIVLDLRLPGLDGFEVCRRVKSSPLTADIRVLPLTAVYTSDADRRRAIALGADGYLVRPLTPGELVATVTSLIGTA
jgi:DNA-binding response OmpR family regulator